ncbi:hypothetical protein [Agromyces marinus]|uniref:Uncharacterized protein n=1 Tax=Agromyces marinus TaxID=1389020 RepID=A0ABN6YFJ8_9MICO|nr:hypothetical protein [Agromyces marinus]UIP59083.1 hypothetical protein DSM26151_19780 [Agromyces marinus]BDZ55931.1 hypothetical protein GCM10025870_30040 [Agromyces marinus]
MPVLRSRGRVAPALVGGITAVLLLAGCAGPVQELVEDGVRGAVEDATGGQVELSGELTADFPASVPVIDGTIELAGGSAGGEGWMVVLSSTAPDALGDARSELEAAGFSEDRSVSGENAGGAVYSDGQHLVILVGDGSTVTYTVTPAP